MTIATPGMPRKRSARSSSARREISAWRLRRRGQRELQDRLRRRVERAQDRLAHLERQLVAHRVDGVAHLVGGLDHVLVEVEDHDDGRQAFGRGRAHLVDAGDALQRLLDAVDELALDRVRRRARVGDGHHQHRLLDVGDLVDAQLLQRQQAERHHRDDDHDHRDRALDRKVRQEHDAPSLTWSRWLMWPMRGVPLVARSGAAPPGLASSTSWPSTSWAFGLRRMRSPSAMPARTG